MGADVWWGRPAEGWMLRAGTERPTAEQRLLRGQLESTQSGVGFAATHGRDFAWSGSMTVAARALAGHTTVTLPTRASEPAF